MKSGPSFSLKVSCRKNELSRVEGFVEDICDYHNIFSTYFGNILVATSEYFTFLGNLFPEKEVELYSQLKEGSLVVGFKLQKHFSDASAFSKRSINDFIESNNLSENERSFLAASLLSDEVFLDTEKQNVELGFKIKSETREREKKITTYIEGISTSSTQKSIKDNSLQ